VYGKFKKKGKEKAFLNYKDNPKSTRLYIGYKILGDIGNIRDIRDMSQHLMNY
jgi:hypothetical protein